MCGVYENAELVIAATHAAHSGGGCYSTTVAKPTSNGFTLPLPNGAPYNFEVRAPLSHEALFLNPPEWSRKSMPLLHRAWVLQERLMSPRNVHFCQAELV